MNKMKKSERVKAAINFNEVDRVPIGLWGHHSDIDQDVLKLAEAQVNFLDKVDTDFIKLMPFGLYTCEDYGTKIQKFNEVNKPPKIIEPFVKTNYDWERVEILEASKGTYGNQVLLAEKVITLLKQRDLEAPVVQTIFSPLTTAFKLAGEQLFVDMKENPTYVHEALQRITQTTVEFIKLNIDAGVSGFFFASQLANYELTSDEQYIEFGQRYDLMLFDVFKDETWFNIVHIHSFTQNEEASMFRRLADYPCNCINWHDRWVGPNLKEARKLTDKCLIGGINEEQYFNKVHYNELNEHIKVAISQAGKRGYMVGPGCTIYEDTPWVNYLTARLAVERYGF